MYWRLESFLSAIDSLGEWSGRIVGYMILPITGLITVEVVLRYGFNSPTIWSTELVTYLTGAFYVLGGAYVLRYRAYVMIDLLYRRFPARVRALIDIASIPLFLALYGALLWGGTEWTWFTLMGGKTSGSVWDPPLFPFVLTIPLAAFLTLLQGFANFTRDLRVAVTGQEVKENER
jgi:TRAP-type mannitol/chloroaromatic compound transport system permease small subunit